MPRGRQCDLPYEAQHRLSDVMYFVSVSCRDVTASILVLSKMGFSEQIRFTLSIDTPSGQCRGVAIAGLQHAAYSGASTPGLDECW